MTAEIKRHIKKKTTVLSDANLTDKCAIEEYLSSKVNDSLPNELNIIRIDRAAREMIEDYYAGDRSFCKSYNENGDD